MMGRYISGIYVKYKLLREKVLKMNSRHIVAASALLLLLTAKLSFGATLFQENFEDSAYGQRSWYDNTSHGTIASGGQTGNCLQWSWGQGATTPTNGGSMRRAFTASDSLYVSFYVKFQTGWRGSGKTYHPHLFYVTSNLDATYAPLANDYLNTYIEFISDTASPYAIRPAFAYQDEMRVNTSSGALPNNLSATTENRSATYCNSPLPSGFTGMCYADNPYYSANLWTSNNSSVSTNSWHFVEVYMQMNTISGGKGQRDGIMQQWVDGVQVKNNSDMLFRTAQDATKKWATFILAPYIGDGSPVAQTMWVDQLTVATSRPGGSTPTTIAAPTNLSVK